MPRLSASMSSAPTRPLHLRTRAARPGSSRASATRGRAASAAARAGRRRPPTGSRKQSCHPGSGWWLRRARARDPSRRSGIRPGPRKNARARRSRRRHIGRGARRRSRTDGGSTDRRCRRDRRRSWLQAWGHALANWRVASASMTQVPVTVWRSRLLALERRTTSSG